MISKRIRIAVGICLAFLVADTSHANIINGSFEDGTIGWTAGVRNASFLDGDTLEPTVYPFSYETILGIPWSVLPGGVDGERRAWRIVELPTALGDWGFQGPDGKEYVMRTTSTAEFTLSQTIDLKAGQVLSGWAEFDVDRNPGPFVYAGGASILVNGEIAWHRGASNPGELISPATGFYRADWEQWKYIVPSDGQYTIEINVSPTPNSLANSSTHVGFDHFSVPDSGATSIGFGIALCVVSLLRAISIRKRETRSLQ